MKVRPSVKPICDKCKVSQTKESTKIRKRDKNGIL